MSCMHEATQTIAHVVCRGWLVSETKMQKQMRCLLTLKLVQALQPCKCTPLLFVATMANPINLLPHMHEMLLSVLAVRKYTNQI